MRYVTTVLTEFDEQLFDECYADCDEDMWANFPREVFIQSGANDYSTRKATVKQYWQNKEDTAGYISYKVTDTETGIDMSYAVARISDDSVDVVYVMYKRDPTGSKSWVRDYWYQNFCNQEVSVSTQLGKIGWRAFVVGKNMQDFILSLGVKRCVKIKKKNDGYDRVTPQIDPDTEPGNNCVVFLSPWGWREQQYEDQTV
jgi:hypothetical protein